MTRHVRTAVREATGPKLRPKLSPETPGPSASPEDQQSDAESEKPQCAKCGDGLPRRRWESRICCYCGDSDSSSEGGSAGPSDFNFDYFNYDGDEQFEND